MKFCCIENIKLQRFSGFFSKMYACWMKIALFEYDNAVFDVLFCNVVLLRTDYGS